MKDDKDVFHYKGKKPSQIGLEKTFREAAKITSTEPQDFVGVKLNEEGTLDVLKKGDLFDYVHARGDQIVDSQKVQ